MLRILYLTLGVIALVLGIIGIFLPLLPTTPLVLLAAASFARSSTRLHGWLSNHEVFGSTIRQWETSRTIPPKAKIISIVLLNTSLLLSVLVLETDKVLLPVLLLISFSVSSYIYRIPSK